MLWGAVFLVTWTLLNLAHVNVVKMATFFWSAFEFVIIAWTRPCAVSSNAHWWQLWAVPLVLGSILGITTLYVLIEKARAMRAVKDSLAPPLRANWRISEGLLLGYCHVTGK